MLISKASYFDSFRCIAGACPDSCCKEWDVQVDDASAAYYRSLPGALGDRLRQVLRCSEYGTVMAIEDGRCPMWRRDGLCRIQSELGEAALCQTCREFPRLRHDYSDFLELDLELSCPEAARLIFTEPLLPDTVQEVPGGEEPEYDTEAMEVLKATRSRALALLELPRPVGERLALILLFGYQAQAELDGETGGEFLPDAALAGVADFLKPGSIRDIADFFRTLEILTPGWEQLLATASHRELPPEAIRLARYLIRRYWLQAVSDYDLSCRVKFMIVSCLLVSSLAGDFPETAQLFSKEIENNLDNVESLLDAAYSLPAFTDDKLLGMLLGQ